MKRLILIDAHAIIHRAYHALPPLTTPEGEPINAVYGFSTILLRILRELKPDYVVAAFDLPGPTFRHVVFARYKAQRPETPSDLSGQFSKTEELLEALAIPVFKKEGYEADDIIGTISRKLERQKSVEVIVVTGDMDALQLVRPGLKVYSMKKGITETVIYDEKAVRERYGLTPHQLIDFKGLKGDPSDNIPGVKGIGEKIATELIQNFGSIDGIYKELAKGTKKISVSVGDKLRAGEEDARFSKELATINKEVPLEFDMKKTEWRDGTRLQELKLIFQKFGFFSLLKRLEENPRRNPTSEPVQSVLLGAAEKRPAVISVLSSIKDFENFEEETKKSRRGLIFLEGGLFMVSEDGPVVFRVSEKILSQKKVQVFFRKNTFMAHDGKSILRFLKRFKIPTLSITFDLMLAAYLTSTAGRDFSYASIVSRELGRGISDSTQDELSHFFEVARRLEAKISLHKLERVLYDIEQPAVTILADMEERGVLLNKVFLKKLGSRINTEIGKLVEKIYSLAGGEFNINSSQQLSRILFERLGIKTYGLKKTIKGGVISTRESELEKLRDLHPIIKQVLQYRELSKLKTTYVDVLPRLADRKTGKVHTTFNQTGTATGRLSSSDPNLQNIPIQSSYGKEVRKAFVAAKGFELASFDYSQIELRVAAHLADDPKMIEAFQQGLDIHKMTAAEIYNVPLGKVTPEFRRAAKTLNFGVLYGMGPASFSENTGMTKEEARGFIEEYFRDFSGIQRYVAETKRKVLEQGYVETLFGRRRYIPEINSPNWQIRREAERMAVNMPIQGTATGDIVKLAMIKVDEWIRKEKLGEDVRMLLQVHDELVFEIKKKLLKSSAEKIKYLMEQVTKLKVPVLVDVKAGPNWGEQKNLIFNWKRDTI